ncbi:MAG: hypothetical protein ACYTHK_09450 [Planctomycetota bacterium]|jgi:hypothetical protein
MRGLLLLAAMTTFVAIAAAQSDKLTRIKMKNGRQVVGYVVEKECSNENLVLRDMRTKKKMTIPWSKVKADVARKLRIDLGFEVAEAKGGHKLEADQIRNRTGNLFTGVVLNRETARADGHYKLKTADGVLKIQLADIREERKVEVDATMVYTPRELYEKKLAEKAPETAADEFQLAEYARLIGALPEAKQHYEKLLAYEDPKYPESAINRLIERVDKLMASTEAVDKLRSIERHIVYNRFEKAKAELDEFTTKYKEERDFMLEAEKLAEKLEAQRKEYYTEKVAGMLRDAIKDVLNKKVREDELSVREAQNFAAAEVGAEQSASRMAVEMIAAKLKIGTEEVMDLWKERPKRVIHKAFYRDGTFIVLDDLEDALAKAPKPKVPKGKQAPKLPKPRPIMTPDKWWDHKRKTRKWRHMADFLYAYWAEKSGAVELVPEKFETCPTCVGKGYIIQSVMTQQGNAIYADRCNTCYMSKGFRIVRFK